ncbi:MAG: hypothetical protein FWE13_00495 [Firmicutes bacterium]|nr:hypothetical protein [Bacillota bacterium]
MQNDIKTQFKSIDVSLSSGKFLTGKSLGFLYFALICCLPFPLLTIVMLVIKLEWDASMITTIISGNLFTLFLFIILLFIVLKNCKLKKKILLWLEDSVALSAYSKEIATYKITIMQKSTSIQVQFTISGKNYKRNSGYNAFGEYKGCSSVFNKYSNRRIKNLYSYKYDEVLILKDF